MPSCGTNKNLSPDKHKIEFRIYLNITTYITIIIDLPIFWKISQWIHKTCLVNHWLLFPRFSSGHQGHRSLVFLGQVPSIFRVWLSISALRLDRHLGFSRGQQGNWSWVFFGTEYFLGPSIFQDRSRVFSAISGRFFQSQKNWAKLSKTLRRS